MKCNKDCFNCKFDDCIDEPYIYELSEAQKARASERNKANKKRKRQEAKANGMCQRCFKKPVYKGIYCRECYNYHKRKSEERCERLKDPAKNKKAWAEAGLCHLCGADPLPGKKVCARCYEKCMVNLTKAKAVQREKRYNANNELWKWLIATWRFAKEEKLRRIKEFDEAVENTEHLRMNMENLIKSKERVKDFGEVFTPADIVNEMLDALPEEVFQPEKTFLEPACGEGAFLMEILKRKFANCKERKDYTVALESVYGFELQADNVQICIDNVTNLCTEYFRINRKEQEIINTHIIQADGLKVMAMLSDRQVE